MAESWLGVRGGFRRQRIPRTDVRCRMARSSSRSVFALILLTSCAPATAIRSERGDTDVRASRGAFVVVSDSETLVVPVDPSAPVVRAEGIWLLDETDGTVVRPMPSAESRGRAQCRALGTPTECTLQGVVRLQTELDATLDPACSCFVGEDTQRCDDDPFAYLGFEAWETSTGVSFDELLDSRREGDEEDEEYGGNDYLEEDDEDCEDSTARVVSLHAGTLYSETSEHNGCNGLNMYGSSSLTTELTGDARAFGLRDADEVACDPDGAFLDGWAVRSESEGFIFRDDRWDVPEDADDADYGLERCERFASPDGEVVFHEGRHLLVVGADVDVTGGGARFSARLGLGRETCTSADPCGSPEAFVAFEGIEADDPSMTNVYVASDDSAALALGGRQLDVFRPRDQAPARTVPFAGELVGVRFHTDPRRLVRAMELEARHETQQAAGDDACDAGYEDVEGECRIRCAQDLDCRGAMGCEAVCREGLCDDEAVACNAAHPCGVDSLCRGGSCETLDLAEADEGFEDARGGTGWGNRCIAHLRAGRLDAAQAACAAGLAAATRDTTRGALLYNLGLIAELRGDRVSARLDYEASLRARPNSTVERALAALGGPLEP